MIARLLVIASIAGCLERASVQCEDGRICPENTACTPHWCVTDDQLAACAGQGELADCTLGNEPGLCQEGACIPKGCGDRQITDDEECDGDALGANAVCSDLDDVGYHDAAPLSCTPLCTYDVSACVRRCGDEILDPEEDCDAELGVVIDACTRYGFYEGDVTCSAACSADLSACGGRCGDGVLDPTRELCEPSIPDSIPPGTCLSFGYDAGRFGCSAFCGPGFAECREIGWPRAFSGVTGQWEKLWVSPSSDLFAVGEGFSVLQISDGRTRVFDLIAMLQWTPQALWGASASDVYVGTYGGSDDASGQIAHWDGAAWSEVQIPPIGSILGIGGTSSSDVWAVGIAKGGTGNYIARILHGDGANWVVAYDSPESIVLWDIWASAPDDVYAVGEESDIFGDGVILHFNGTSWARVLSVPNLDLKAVWGSGPADVFAIGSGRQVFHFDGISWQSMGELANYGAYDDLWGRAPDDVYAVDSFEGTIVHYDGSSWWTLEMSPAVGLTGVAGSATELFVAAPRDTIHRHAGAAWSREMPSPQAVGVSLGADGALAVAGGSTVVRRGTSSWTATAAPSAPYTSIWVHGATSMFSGDANGVVRQFNGTAWGSSPTLGSGIIALWGTAPTNVLALLANGKVATWNGSLWTTAATAATGTLVALSGTSATNVFAVGGTASASEIRRFNGTTWSAMAHPPAGATLRDVWAAAGDDVWAVGAGGTILHYDGATWSAVESGTEATLYGVRGTAADDVWAAGANGTILHYDGVSWTQVRSPIEATYLDVDVRDRLVVLGAGASGTVTLIRRSTW